MIIKITTKDGSDYTITNKNLVSTSYRQDSSSDNEFLLGFAASCSFNFSMKDFEGEYDDVNFLESTCELYNDEQTIKKGTFSLKKLTTRDEIYNFEYIDNMVKFDKRFKEQKFNGNIVEFLQLICSDCNVVLGSYSEILNQDIQITNTDVFLNMNYREILQSLCEVTGTFALINEDGELTLKWYNEESSKDILYSTLHQFELDESLSSPKELNGIVNGLEFKTWTDEPEGYVLYLSNNNPVLMNLTEVEVYEVLNNIKSNRLNDDFEYNSLDLQKRIDWELNVGDKIRVQDRKGNFHNCFITNLTFRNDSIMSLTSSGENHDRNYTSVNNDNTNLYSYTTMKKFQNEEILNISSTKTFLYRINNIKESSCIFLNHLLESNSKFTINLYIEDELIKSIDTEKDIFNWGIIIDLEKTMKENILKIEINGNGDIDINKNVFSFILVDCNIEESQDEEPDDEWIIIYDMWNNEEAQNPFNTLLISRELIIEDLESEGIGGGWIS